MNNTAKKIISATLALSLSVTLAVNAYAEEIAKVHKQVAVSTEVEAVKEKSEKAKKPEKIKITKDNLPEVLDFDRVKEQGFVSRLKSEETDMCEIVLENEDGTRGLYVFDSPVKFKNEKGEIVDKSNKVKPHNKNGAPCFKSESNDIDVNLPVALQTGVSLKDEELNVIMKPLPSAVSKRTLSTGKQKDENSVIYENVFDNNTDIIYTFTYDGVKEDIVLEKYNGKNTFDFEVLTGGLSLEEEKGALLLKDENGEVKATMGEIVIFSADNKNNTFGEYKITEKQKNNSYIITVCVDVAYLTSPKTKYPVTIDPTTSIKSSKDDCGIEDMQVFKGVDGMGNETSSGLSGVSRVGWTDWGACRTLMRFANLDLSKKIKDPKQINTAYIELRDLMCQGDAVSIICSEFTGQSWDESDVEKWNDLNAGSYGTTGSGVSVSYGKGNSNRTDKQWYRWDIKTIAQKWVGNNNCQEKGVVFRLGNSTYEINSKYAKYMKTFSSMQGNSNYKPYFCIEYEKADFSPLRIGLDTEKDGGVYWIRKKGTNSYLTTNGWLSRSNVGVENHRINDFEDYESVSEIQKMELYWKLNYIESDDGGYYTITPLDSPETFLDVLSSVDTNGSNVGIYHSDEPYSSSYWRIERKGTSNDGVDYYTILSKFSGCKKGLNVNGTNVDIYDINSKSNYWEFIKVECPSYYENGVKYAGGHPLEAYEDLSGYLRYKCKLCDKVFLSPEEQDIDNLGVIEFATVIALERAYVVEKAKGNNKDADCLLRIINHIRKKYGNSITGISQYDFRDKNGKYYDHVNYEFDSYDDTYVTLSISDLSNLEKTKPFASAILTTGSMIPGPLSLFFSGCSLLWDLLENGEPITVSDLISFAIDAVDFSNTKIVKKFREQVFPLQWSVISGVNTSCNYMAGIRNLKTTEVKMHENMLLIDIDIYKDDYASHFAATYYFDAKDDIRIQSEVINEGSTYPNAHFFYGKFAYNLHMVANMPKPYRLDLLTGEYVPSSGI